MGGISNVNLEYRGDTARVGLAKHVYPWIGFDVLSAGTGFFLDDLSNKWYDYNAVCAMYDTMLHLSSTQFRRIGLGSHRAVSGHPSSYWAHSVLARLHFPMYSDSAAIAKRFWSTALDSTTKSDMNCFIPPKARSMDRD